MAQKISWFAKDTLKKWRNANGYSQLDCAEFISLEGGEKISTSLYQKWETGEIPISTAHILLLRKLIGTPYDYFVERREHEIKENQ